MKKVGNLEKYPELAKKSPVYAQLRNLVDMLVATAFMQKQDYYGKAGWSLETFGSEKRFPVETHHAPKQVLSAVNSIWKGSRLMTPIGGGVMISASRALESDNLLSDEEGLVGKARARVNLQELAKNAWWWD